MILAVFNPKGGVGKTTTAVNLGTLLADAGKSVLVVDAEADHNASISLGVPRADLSPSLAEVLLHQERPAVSIRPVRGIDGVQVITGSPALVGIDASLRHVRQPERRLSDILRPLTTQFDVIIVDAPAGYSILSESILVAADYLVVPIRAEYLSLESLAQFLRWYRDRSVVRKGLAPIAGILLTIVDYRHQATREIIDIIRVHNRRGVFKTEIPADPRVAEAPSHGVPVVRYAPRTKASLAYARLTRELVGRLRRRG